MIYDGSRCFAMLGLRGLGSSTLTTRTRQDRLRDSQGPGFRVWGFWAVFLGLPWLDHAANTSYIESYKVIPSRNYSGASG